MSVSERIAKRREELKLTQTELARRAGLKPPTISQYESGTRSPSYEALIKLSSALDVTSDFLISGGEIKSDLINEKTAKILINVIQNMSIENREKLLQYASFLTNTQVANFGIPILNSPAEYSDYVYKNFSNGEVPVNVFEIATKMGISIYYDNLQDEYEGLLVKSSGKCFAVLDKNMDFERRIKFTLSTLIGHAAMPWHLKSNYYIRKKGTSTLHTIDFHEMEAQKFAAFLLMPQIHFMKDLNKEIIGMDGVKELAENRYDISVTAFLNQMVDFRGEKYAFIQSKSHEIVSMHQGKRPIVEAINENSSAYSFYKGLIPQQEEVRNAEVPASFWFSDAEKDETVFESSIFNPKFGNALTLVTIK